LHPHESNAPCQELPIETRPPQDKKEEIEIFSPETVKHDPPEDFPLFIHQVGDPFSKKGEATPFYVLSKSKIPSSATVFCTQMLQPT